MALESTDRNVVADSLHVVEVPPKALLFRRPRTILLTAIRIKDGIERLGEKDQQMAKRNDATRPVSDGKPLSQSEAQHHHFKSLVDHTLESAQYGGARAPRGQAGPPRP
jgi:hypothetical protein